MTTEQSSRIKECYSQYCGIIKPLIAEIEARAEAIPLPIFNEIRAFNDHIARCYYQNPSQAYINEQIEKAQRHITRITLDCFKCLDALLYARIALFDQQTKNIDLTVIDNGTFYPKYCNLKQEALLLVEQAKKTEAINIDESLSIYQNAYNRYNDLVELILRNSETVRWARRRFKIRRWLTPILWIASVIVSAIVSAYFSCEFFQALLS